MPVEEMLQRMSSRELSEWRCYEELTGLVGPKWSQEMLREIHYLLQVQHHTMVQLKTERGKNNPVAKPERIPGPADFVKFDDGDDEDWDYTYQPDDEGEEGEELSPP